jgi:hypothetical protein
MTIRAIPKTIPALVKACARALAGAQSSGATLGVAQNTATKIATDYHDYVGVPGSTTELGKRGVLNDKRDGVKVAREARHAAIAAGREFCAGAIDRLKPHLGRVWNAAWMTAGFTRGTLEVPRSNPLSLLLQLREYLRANPAREIASESFTAAQADTLAVAAETTEAALDAAITARRQAAQQSDAAIRQMGRRLSGLREELDRLLAPDDMRWHEFGFSRPVDSKMPEPVTGLVVTPGLPGQVLVQHAASARALDYRVSWTPQVSGGVPTEVGLFADLAVTLSGLPSGLTVVVSVTARNAAGETQPAFVTIVVP